MRTRITSVLAGALALAALGACARSPHDATSHRSFADVDHWVRVFDDPERLAWQKPDAVVAALALRAGESVADLGAGTGYFMSRLAAAVGKRGTVYAVETEPKLLAHLRERAEGEGLGNVVLVLGSPDHPRLPPGSVDVLLLVDTYHHIDDRVVYFRDAMHLLRAGGRVVVVDWKKQELPVGPPLDHKLARAHVESEMRQSGYRLVDGPDLLPYQYVLIFTPEHTREGE